MLSALADTEHYRFWPVWSLLHGWGIDDPEVAAVLEPLPRMPAEDRQHIAHHIPEIVGSVDDSFRRPIARLRFANGCRSTRSRRRILWTRDIPKDRLESGAGAGGIGNRTGSPESKAPRTDGHARRVVDIADPFSQPPPGPGSGTPHARGGLDAASNGKDRRVPPAQPRPTDDG